MIKHIKRAGLTALASALLVGTSGLYSAGAMAVEKSDLEKGKEIAFSRKTGNCLACHAIDGGNSPGNIAPPLSIPNYTMKQRYPERQRLYNQIHDATQANPLSVMPPFGKHNILSKKEMELLVDYIWSL